MRLRLATCLSTVSISICLCLSSAHGVLGQQSAVEDPTEQIELTARSCQVQVGEFESACESVVRLLDNEQISVIFVTVKSVPEEHEISFYTEHVGMLVVGVDGGMLPMSGDCRNNARALICDSPDRMAMLEVRW